MRHGERVVVYSGLALAIALGAGWRLGSSAWAGEGTIRAGEVRPAADPKVGMVDVLTLTERVFQTDKYKPARDTMEKELREKLQLSSDLLLGIETRIKQMQDKGVQQSAPEFQAAVQDYNAKREAAGQEQTKANQQFAALRNKQIIDAYREVQAAAQGVADKEGITLLFAARPSGDMNFGQAEAVIEIISRPLLKTPAGSDITEAVAKELKLPAIEVKPVEIKPAEPNVPAAKPEGKPATPPAPR